MGRYYNSNNFNGKFAFAVQSSSDPEFFGMEEQEPTEITYYLEDSEEARKEIKNKLDEQYDILEYPKEKRVYSIKKEEELNPLYDDMDKYIYRYIKNDELPEGVIGYASIHDGWWKQFVPDELKSLSEVEFRKNYSIIPKNGNTPLAMARIALGIRILSDLMLDGYCELYAEL